MICVSKLKDNTDVIYMEMVYKSEQGAIMGSWHNVSWHTLFTASFQHSALSSTSSLPFDFPLMDKLKCHPRVYHSVQWAIITIIIYCKPAVTVFSGHATSSCYCHLCH